MPSEYVGHERDSFGGRDVREAKDSGVILVAMEDQFPEVSIDRNQDSAFARCPLEHGPIAWVGTAVPNLRDIVPFRAQKISDLVPGASIDQELHFSTTRTASMES